MPLLSSPSHQRLNNVISDINNAIVDIHPGYRRIARVAFYSDLTQHDQLQLRHQRPNTVTKEFNLFDADYICMVGLTNPEHVTHPNKIRDQVVIFQAKEINDDSGSYILHATYYESNTGFCETVRYLPNGFTTEDWQLKRETEIARDAARFLLFGDKPSTTRT